MKRVVIVLTLLAAFVFVGPVSALGDRYELWVDTNGDMYVDAIIDTDPGAAPEFSLTVPVQYSQSLKKVLDTATSAWTPVTGSSGTYARCKLNFGSMGCDMQ